MADIALPPSSVPPLILSVSDACAALGGIGRVTLYKLIDRGDVARVKLNRRTFVTFESICAYVDRMKASA